MSGLSIALSAMLVVSVLTMPCPGRAQPDGERTTCDAYLYGDYEDALAIADNVIRSGAGVPVKVGAYKCQAATYVALVNDPGAIRSIRGMLTIDGTARFSPDFYYPPRVIELYHTVHDSMLEGSMDIETVAVGDFEDNSIFQGKFKDYDFSLFRGALVHTVIADLAEATPLKIVDRQRTNQLLDEIELGGSGFADPEQAVRVGRFLGAHTFIFGQYMILSKEKVRIDARVVHTATGQIIVTKNVTGEFAGDPEKFLQLERELVEGLAEGIEEILAAGNSPMKLGSLTQSYFDEKQEAIGERKGYVESKYLIAEAFDHESRGAYDEAIKTWQEVLKTDPMNEEAKVRIRVLEQQI